MINYVPAYPSMWWAIQKWRRAYAEVFSFIERPFYEFRLEAETYAPGFITIILRSKLTGRQKKYPKHFDHFIEDAFDAVALLRRLKWVMQNNQ